MNIKKAGIRELSALFAYHERKGCGTKESVARLTKWLAEVEYDPIYDAFIFPDGTVISVTEANQEAKWCSRQAQRQGLRA